MIPTDSQLPGLLFLSPRVPWPLNTGAKIRTHALLKALSEQFTVQYAGFLQPDLEEAEARRQLSFCSSVWLKPEPATTKVGKAGLAIKNLFSATPVNVAKYWNGSMADFVHCWLQEHPEAIAHADHLHMASYLKMRGAGLKVIDEHNFETQIMERMADQYQPTGLAKHPIVLRLIKRYLRIQARRLGRKEAELTSAVDLVLAVSPGDGEKIRAICGDTRVEVIPNGVAIDYFTPGGEEPRSPKGGLVFTGSMNWLPNQDGVRYFVEDIFSRLVSENGQNGRWRFDIVGHNPPGWIRELASSQIRVTGSVPDVRPYMEQARIFVVPLRIGGGSRLKILEAFAMRVPVVSTSVGCEGLDVVHERQLLIADTPRDFAAAIRRLEEDEGLREALISEAQRFVKEHYSWERIGGQLCDLYQNHGGAK